jgi:TonB-dependent receptor
MKARGGWLLLLLAGSLLAAEPVLPERVRVDLPAGMAAQSLRQFAAQTGLQVIFRADLLPEVATPAVHGSYSPREALDRLLEGTPLAVVLDSGSGAFAIIPRTGGPGGLPPVVRHDSEKNTKPEALASSAPPPDPAPMSSRKNFLTRILHTFFPTEPVAASRDRTDRTDATPPGVSERKRPAGAAWRALLGLAAASTGTAAEGPAPGTIEGRVFNNVTSRYLYNARVTVIGQNLEQLTDPAGQYRFGQLSPGEVTLQVAYTGLETLQKTVRLAAGQTLVLDLNLEGAGGRDNEAVKLEAFVVASGRETDGAAIAINEQRYAPNLKNIVATSEYGENTDGDIEEFVKFIPGVAAGLGGIRIRGFTDTTTTLNIDGNRVASASDSNESRTVNLKQLLLQNVSRIEVTKVPTPDHPADSVSGSVNLVSKSAFERARPELTYRTFLSWRGGEPFSLKATPGPDGKHHKTTPGIDLNWIVPVSRNLGFTLTATHVVSSSPADFVSLTWTPQSGVPAGQTSATSENPYLRLYTTRDSPRLITRTSAGITVDYRLTPYDVLSFGFSYTNRDLVGLFHAANFNVGTVVTGYAADFTQGGAGRGSVSLATTANSTEGKTYQPNLSYRHNGKVWRFDTALSYAFSSEAIPPAERSRRFNSLNLTLGSVTVRYDNIGFKHADVSATSTAGAPVDYYALNNYTFSTANEATRASSDVFRTLRANLSRDFEAPVRFTAKIGLDVRDNIRDIDRWSYGYTFVGRDGVAGSADDRAGFLLDEDFSSRQPPYGYAQKFQYASPLKAYDLFATNPSYYRISNARSSWQSHVNASKWLNERVSAGYLRLDTRLLQNRLWLVGGVRYEHTMDDGYGPLVDPRLAPRGLTDLVAADQYTYVRRGTHTKMSYGDFYPSLSGTFTASENLLLRAAYSRTLSRPDLSNILPGATVPDPDTTARTISLRNTALKPWEADNFDLALEYYFKGTGSASVGVFRKNVTNYIGSVTVPATAELLEPYAIDPVIYGADRGYVISTQMNTGNGSVQGLELGYKQNLTFLPPWAAGVQIFGTFTRIQTGGDSARFLSNAFSPRAFTLGTALKRRRFNLDFSVTAQGRFRFSEFTGVGVPPDTQADNYQGQIYSVSGAFVINKHLQLFFSGRDLKSAYFFQRRYDPKTPQYAKFFSQTENPATYSIGIKGTY